MLSADRGIHFISVHLNQSPNKRENLVLAVIQREKYQRIEDNDCHNRDCRGHRLVQEFGGQNYEAREVGRVQNSQENTVGIKNVTKRAPKDWRAILSAIQIQASHPLGEWPAAHKFLSDE